MDTPDCWVVVKLFSEKMQGEVVYKILAGWYDDYYRLNSGIVKIDDFDDHWLVHGYSGSVYRCGKQSERTSGYTRSIYKNLENQMRELDPDGICEIVPIFEVIDALDSKST
jgi:hypothetical protein